MTSTPPAVTTISTPPTPLHGARYDNPYSLRKSSRLSQQRAARTPSPTAWTSSFGSNEHGELRRTPKSRSARRSISPPSSPISSPPDTIRRMPKTKLKSLAPEAARMNGVGLPTPIKTPRKRPSNNPGSAARVLFARSTPHDELMPSPYKRRSNMKNHVGFTLDSFGEDDAVSNNIEIYTDSKEKIPELDERDDNPFYEKAKEVGRRSSKRKRDDSVTNNEEVQDALERGEGMVYVFRGRKIYKKFNDTRSGSPTPGGTTAAQESEPESPHHHLTRSSIKPRRLFPKASETRGGTTTDEEAVTDIEDPEAHGIAMNDGAKAAAIPVKEGHLPPTPPTTSRARRIVKQKVTFASARDSSPISRDGNSSPFDSWRRTKPAGAGAGAASALKRGGEAIVREDAAKKARESV